VGPCVLAAESAGAGVALQAVQRAPDRFMGQVLVGAAWQRTLPGASDAFITSLRSNYTATLSGFVDNCLPETRSAELRRWGLQILSRAQVDDAVTLLKCRETLPPDDALPRLTLPTLLVHGCKDRIVPPQSARDLAHRLGQAELRVLPGLGHVPIATESAQVAQLIDTFGMRLSVSTAGKTAC
jgi:pimeloyl-ACP methyl ester carboxylesterase